MSNQSAQSSSTILIVDDTPTNLKVISEYLSHANFRVLVARNSESALQRVQHGQPDLILLDILMPGTNGYEMCRMLKADPRTAAIPVIFMTALGETENKVRGFQMGAVDYITKPIHQEELLARIRTHLQLRSLTETLEKRVAKRTLALEQALARQEQLIVQLKESLQRERELSAVQSRVMQVISHEFRTPLNAINNSTHLLLSYYDRMSQNKRESVGGHIRESILYMTELLDNALHLQSLDELEKNLQPEFVDVCELCCEAIAAAELQFGSRRLSMSHDGEQIVCVDPKLLLQLLNCVISNAYKFSGEDDTVRLQTSVDDQALQIVLFNDGIGIVENDLPNVFDLFYRGGNTIGYPGLGIGLSSAKRIVAALDGQISYTSDGAGSGASVQISLPVKRLAD